MGEGTTESAREIVVVGGGIGGLTTALALARDGRSVRVLERAERFAEVGAGLQLAPNATGILRRLGAVSYTHLDVYKRQGSVCRALTAH